MKYKYLSISGTEIEMESDDTKEEILSGVEEDGEVISATPIIEIDDVPYWNPKTQYGNFTKKQWIKKVCPQLVKIYG